ncbi:hypothetical protein QQX98_010624 [Neonectria punicea]|uniref:Zn(2)-C6 fungal-type domain-containing protein n=1 Tax=Neonectria punicea TaxID=979145 RepID=A0ABR1GP05_9HYPO
MVYCGKASQGCQNCRTRRIKCDKVRPDCSQCIRVGKKCPGYRDQLSLMFRDESSKVIQKAHAQWGVGDAPLPDNPQLQTASKSIVPSSSSSSSSSSASSASSASSSSSTAPWAASPTSVVTHRLLPPTPPSPASSQFSSSQPSSSTVLPPAVVWPLRLPSPVDPSLEEQGVQFYINRYLIGHPDEPRTASDLAALEWLWDPSLQDVMTAVGLASLSNLRGDKSLMTTARQRYGQALRQTGQVIQTSVTPSFEVTMRGVVMLAMFELVKGTHQGIAHVNAHIVGGVALLRRWCPMPEAAFGGVRAMVQMCFSLFIPACISNTPLPEPFYEWAAFSSSLLDPEDRPATGLGLMMARFIQISAYIEIHVLSDGRPNTTSILQQLLDLDAEFVEWEQTLGVTWLYRTEKANDLPPTAVFQGQYHVYYDMWAARMWGHYRWARILVNQAIVNFVNNNPLSSLPLISATEHDRRFKIIRELARDVLMSTPSHWRHPLLDDRSTVPVDKPGGAGSGSAGIPIVLFQIKLAACAPGVPAEYWDWVYGVMECIWSDLGMLHAKSMMETMRAHKDALHRAKADGILTHGE